MNLHKQVMQQQGQFDRILDICKSFSPDFFLSSCVNLQHCGRKPRCTDVEIIAPSLFQEFLHPSIANVCFFLICCNLCSQTLPFVYGYKSFGVDPVLRAKSQTKKNPYKLLSCRDLADRVGFEPSVRF